MLLIIYDSIFQMHYLPLFLTVEITVKPQNLFGHDNMEIKLLSGTIMDRRHDFPVMHNFICLSEKNIQKYTLIHKLACMETNTLHNIYRK